MTSDEKRREVAARLRSKKPEEFTFPFGKTVFTHIFRSVFPNQMPLTNWILRVPYRLADLIDQPTCQMVECAIDHGSRSWGMRCTACGKEFEHVKPGFWWRYCPNCGAVVVSADD